ncbi:unnamed protein product [Scytosiphon promiscuus]
MPGYEERASILRGAGDMIFNMVCDRATPEQWADWLRAPLEHAAATANAELVDKLLKAGADGGAGRRGCDGRTLLHAGAEGGDEKVMEALMVAGSQADVSTSAGRLQRTPLHVAALHGKVAAAKTLLLAGANRNSLDVKDDTPLHLAIVGGHAEVAEDLLLSGANPYLQNCSYCCPLHLAACHDRAGVMRNLLHVGVGVGVGVDFRTLAVGTALMLAVNCGSMSTLQVLLEAGADATFARLGGSTPLHMAALRNGGTEMMAALVDAGADMEARTQSGDTPLLLSVGQNKLPSALLRMGANVNACRNDGSSPLHFACEERNAVAADQLLRWGADETAVDENGCTPSERIPAVADGDCQELRLRVERLSKLLEFAPQDRAWRRRGFLVLCRAHPERLQLGRQIPDTAGPAGGTPERPPRRIRLGREGIEVTNGGVGRPGEGGLDASMGRTTASDFPDGAGRGRIDGVASWVIGLTDENVFRGVVGYL